MIDKILVATDGSASSNRAVATNWPPTWLLKWLHVHNASLHAINVIRQIQIPPEMQNMARVESLGENRLSVLEFIANQILDDADSRVQAKGVTLVKKSIGYEDPATSISKYAVKHDMDLVVIGTRGLNKVEALLMGSVSRKVAEICNVNCLIVR